MLLRYANDDPAGERSSTIYAKTGRTYERETMSGQPSTVAGRRSSRRSAAAASRYFPTAIPKIANAPVLTVKISDGALLAVIGPVYTVTVASLRFPM